MVKEVFPIKNMQGRLPSVDPRGSPEVFVLEGRNYVFDSKGPKSGFGNRLLSGGEVIENVGGVAQSVDVGNKSFVFTSIAAYQMLGTEETWTEILDLTPFANTIVPDDKKWTGVFLTDGIYLCHPVYGFYKYETSGLVEKTRDDIPGLPFKPVAIGETNGRLIVLGVEYVAWSGSSAEDFTPTLGGAGQQLLSDRVAGNPVTLSAFQTGFLVWTEKDCLTAEFIAGDNVFRFDRMTTKQIPIGAFAVENMPNGQQTICTKQGLFETAFGREPTMIAPLFSEFIREFLKNEPGIRVRLTYQIEADRLYVQIRDWTNHYVRTFVLSASIDRWGEFSERHLGIIQFKSARGSFGFVDSAGIAHRFVETFTKETLSGLVGLDSEITIGYIRPPRLQPEADTLLEMQELTLGSYLVRPSWDQPIYIDCGHVDDED